MIVVIGCGREKLEWSAPAWMLYTGQLFAAHYRLARALRPRRILIASAKYGLIDHEDHADPYEKTVRDMSPDEREAWARGIAEKVDALAKPREIVVVLSGRDYSEWRQYARARTTDMLEGMTVGDRRGVVSRLLSAEQECADRDRDHTRERLAARHEQLMAEDPDYRASVEHAEEIKQRLRQISLFGEAKGAEP